MKYQLLKITLHEKDFHWKILPWVDPWYKIWSTFFKASFFTLAACENDRFCSDILTANKSNSVPFGYRHEGLLRLIGRSILAPNISYFSHDYLSFMFSVLWILYRYMLLDDKSRFYIRLSITDPVELYQCNFACYWVVFEILDLIVTGSSSSNPYF